MANLKFEAHKLRRELWKSGVIYKFFRHKLNDFGEKSGELEEVGSILGLYHELSFFVTKTSGDSGVTRTKKQPRLLVLAEDFIRSGFQMDDEVTIQQVNSSTRDKVLRLVGWDDIGNWGIVADLSFEEVDNAN